jgi:hypothetical protein
MSVLVCLIGALMFLAVAVAPNSLESASSNVEIELQGAGTSRQPILLECTAQEARSLDGTLVFTREGEEGAMKGTEWRGTPFTDFLNDLGAREAEEYVLFLVRPDGLEVFSALRAVLVLRNRSVGRKSVPIAEKPDEEALQQLAPRVRAHVSFADDTLSYDRAMTEEARDALRVLFREEQSLRGLDDLFDRSKHSLGWVDYGSELLPKGWNVKGAVAKER